MKLALLEILACPGCAGTLRLETKDEGEIVDGTLACTGCSEIYPITNGIPRFVKPDNYAMSFGYQWNLFSRTQLDTFNGTSQSADRFYPETGWTKEGLKGKWVLDAGCGAGRFLDVVSQNECQVVGIDLSSAIDASKKNLEGRENLHLIQASIYELPFKAGVFDACYSIGVIQHTPDPAKTMATLPKFLKTGGEIAVTIYERKPWTMLYSKYWFRPITRRMTKESLLKAVKLVMPLGFAVTNVLFKVPGLKKVFQFTIPIANYVDKTDLTRDQRYDWAVLDTFDMLSPAFDQPQTQAEAEKALSSAGIVDLIRRPIAGLVLVGRKG